MKKVVLLAPYFLPRRRVGSWRPYKFAIHLKEFGWAPHIITIHEPKETLTTKEAELLSGIPVLEINSPFDLTHKIGRQLEFNGRAPEPKTKAGTSKNHLKPILDCVDKYFPVDTWLPLFILRQKMIEHFIEEIDPHILWSTGDPWSSHWLASKLADKYGLPWVADFRDPWTLGDIQLKNRSDFAHRIDQKQEEKVVRNASTLTFTSRQTEALYNKKYPAQINKSATIYNSFDSSLFSCSEIEAPCFDDEYLNLMFFGRFRSLSPAEPLINLLSQLKSCYPEIAEKIRIYSFGPLSEAESEAAREKGVDQNFIILKPVALENALPVLRQADILWLSTHPHRKNIIPAKLWDYLAAKRPILSIAPNPEIAEILEQTGAGVQLDINNPTALTNMLCEAVKAKMRHDPFPIPIAFDHNRIKRYDACVATRKLADIFDRYT